MGKAFAILQWGAEVTGTGVEFVLGTTAREQQYRAPWQLRDVDLWLLDFGECTPVNVHPPHPLVPDEVAVYIQFGYAMTSGSNRRFIPRPQDSDLFDAFQTGYYLAARQIFNIKRLWRWYDLHFFLEFFRACSRI
jgi:hypothetical protein